MNNNGKGKLYHGEISKARRSIIAGFMLRHLTIKNKVILISHLTKEYLLHAIRSLI